MCACVFVLYLCLFVLFVLCLHWLARKSRTKFGPPWFLCWHFIMNQPTPYLVPRIFPKAFLRPAALTIGLPEGFIKSLWGYC